MPRNLGRYLMHVCARSIEIVLRRREMRKHGSRAVERAIGDFMDDQVISAYQQRVKRAMGQPVEKIAARSTGAQFDNVGQCAGVIEYSHVDFSLDDMK